MLSDIFLSDRLKNNIKKNIDIFPIAITDENDSGVEKIIKEYLKMITKHIKFYYDKEWTISENNLKHYGISKEIFEKKDNCIVDICENIKENVDRLYFSVNEPNRAEIQNNKPNEVLVGKIFTYDSLYEIIRKLCKKYNYNFKFPYYNNISIKNDNEKINYFYKNKKYNFKFKNKKNFVFKNKSSLDIFINPEYKIINGTYDNIYYDLLISTGPLVMSLDWKTISESIMNRFNSLKMNDILSYTRLSYFDYLEFNKKKENFSFDLDYSIFDRYKNINSLLYPYAFFGNVFETKTMCLSNTNDFKITDDNFVSFVDNDYVFDIDNFVKSFLHYFFNESYFNSDLFMFFSNNIKSFVEVNERCIDDSEENINKNIEEKIKEFDTFKIKDSKAINIFKYLKYKCNAFFEKEGEYDFLRNYTNHYNENSSFNCYKYYDEIIIDSIGYTNDEIIEKTNMGENVVCFPEKLELLEKMMTLKPRKAEYIDDIKKYLFYPKE